MEIIILAGGFGTRLSSHLKDNPKPMIDINGKPFLYYLFEYLNKNNVPSVIISVYYKYEKIIDYFGNNYNGINITYSIDNEALGTGGAIKNAINHSNTNNLIVINGDTYYDIELTNLMNFHLKNNNDITLSVKPKNNFNRYGYVKIDNNNNVKRFGKKEFQSFGYIDGGIICIKNDIFRLNNDKIFSFNEYISKNLDSLKVKVVKFNDIFIDIGTPDDYLEAKNLLN